MDTLYTEKHQVLLRFVGSFFFFRNLLHIFQDVLFAVFFGSFIFSDFGKKEFWGKWDEVLSFFIES